MKHNDPKHPSTAYTVRHFTLFRMFFSARFYYPVYALLFLDFGLSLQQFAVLNGLWALTIVLCEVPSGALADTLGRRSLLIAAGVLMLLEMAVLLLAPIGGGAALFGFFVVNRILSGLAEAAASGADEALVYDALKAAGREDSWGQVLARVQRDTSLAFFFALTIGAAVYDPRMVNAVLNFCGYQGVVVQAQLVKLPIALSLLSALVVLWSALRLRETSRVPSQRISATVAHSWRQIGIAARWIWATPFAFAIILAVMVTDSSVRQFLTLASEYWHVIELPIASYGLIGSGMSLLGIVIPRIALRLTETQTPLRNFFLSCALIGGGLFGLAQIYPYWGILPAACLFAAMYLMNFFASHYLNAIAPSEHRATILSFKGLSTNVAYGLVALLYSGLIVTLQASGEASLASADSKPVFVESLQWLPGYFILTLVMMLVWHRLRFGARSLTLE